MKRTLQAAGLYFAVVFGAGFVLGIFRVLLAVPRLGIRNAELLEAPLMLAATIGAARWVTRRTQLPSRASVRLGMGMVALGLLMAAELATVVAVRGMTLRDYIAGRDPLAGIIYIILLAIFALLPLVVERKPPNRSARFRA